MFLILSCLLITIEDLAKKGDVKPWIQIAKPELMAFTGMKIAIGNKGDTKPSIAIAEPELMAFTGMKIVIRIGQSKETLSHGLQ